MCCGAAYEGIRDRPGHSSRRPPKAATGLSAAESLIRLRKQCRTRVPMTVGPIDEAVIGELISDLSDELMPAVVATFVDEAQQRIQAIHQAVAASDAGFARAQAHTLKGAAATLGALALAETAGAIEQASCTGAMEAARAELATLRQRGDAAIDALNERYGPAAAVDG